MRVLAVAHDISGYGAATSLVGLVSNSSGILFDLVIPDTHETKRIEDNKIKERFGGNVRNVFRCDLYMDWYCYIGCDLGNKKYVVGKRGLEKVFYSLRKKYSIAYSRKQIRDIVKYSNYDLIHLNSITLHHNIFSDIPTLLHVREQYNGYLQSEYAADIRKLAGIIFIDSATKKSVEGLYKCNEAIINNPIDMRTLTDIDEKGILPEIDHEKTTIFSCIGSVDENKGVDFILKAFRDAKMQYSVLVFAGKGKEDYLTYCRSLSEGVDNIIFLGHCDQIKKLYKVSDFIIRGEDRQCIGRTIIEGLFAGCTVIVPGSGRYEDFREQLDPFVEAIRFYSPRNRAELTKLLKLFDGDKRREKTFTSNVKTHVNEIKSFYRQIIQSI